tara:strand:+ start:34 stop:150 length:117 start_codon:yes stop_codon:yes gene_type:complete
VVTEVVLFPLPMKIALLEIKEGEAEDQEKKKIPKKKIL